MYTKKYKLNYYNNSVCIINFGNEIKTEIDGIKYNIVSNHDEATIDITITSKENNDSEFFILYSYLFIFIGYYPKLINNIDLAEKYKTSKLFINPYSSFVYDITNNEFETGYKNYKSLYRKLNFHIDMFSYATSYISEHYSQFIVVFMLQILDGLFDKVKLTRKVKTLQDYFIWKNPDEIYENFDEDTSNINNLKKDVSKFNTTKYISNEKFREKIDEQMKALLTNINTLSLSKKYDFLISYFNENYELFKNLDISNKKCTETRNIFSHVSNSKKIFNGLESITNMYKFYIMIRLILLEEMELKNKINKEYINILVKAIDDRYFKELNKENDKNGRSD